MPGVGEILLSAPGFFMVKRTPKFNHGNFESTSSGQALKLTYNSGYNYRIPKNYQPQRRRREEKNGSFTAKAPFFLVDSLNLKERNNVL
jgi:hypothetical protein